MAIVDRFPLTNEELAEMGDRGVVRFAATEEEYWNLLEDAEYRADFYQNEIIASMSYESDVHSQITSRINYLLQTLFTDLTKTRVHNSNRPLCIPYCDNAIFNPDGSVIQLPAKFYEYRPGMTTELTPILLFEVLSNSTRIRDWGEKLPCYKQIPSLRQMLYVESNKLRVHFIERKGDGDQWLETILEGTEDAIQINEQSILLKNIYEGTDILLDS